MKTFETIMTVRDYECDIQGIVNNANYLHYAEHTRHLFLKHCGLSFAAMHARGIDAVVARMNLQFKTPLRCDDEFVSRLTVRKDGIKYVFAHEMVRLSDGKTSFRGTVDIVSLVDGRLAPCADYDTAFSGYL